MVAAAEGAGEAAFFLGAMAGEIGQSGLGLFRFGEKLKLVMISILAAWKHFSLASKVLWYNCGHESSKQVSEL